MAWEFKREEQQFQTLPEGNYRIRIKAADKATSKTGNDMLVLQFEVSGTNRVIYHYVTFLADRPEITNRTLTQIYDSFRGLAEGDFNLQHWVGKVGAGHIKHEEYQGQIREKISYFIRADKQDALPPWKEPGGPKGTGSAALGDDDFMPVPEGNEELPW